MLNLHFFFPLRSIFHYLLVIKITTDLWSENEDKMSTKYNLLIKSKHVKDRSIFTCMNAYNKTNIFHCDFVLEKFQIVLS